MARKPKPKPPTTLVEYLPSETARERKGVVVDRELEKIYAAHNDVTIDLVLAEAAIPDHALHSYFEWDDKIAGEKYRKVQAYSLISASKFVVQLVENGQTQARTVVASERVRKFVSAFRGEGFRIRRDALADHDMRDKIVETKKAVLRSWCKSTIDIEELQPLRDVILAHLGEAAEAAA